MSTSAVKKDMNC